MNMIIKGDVQKIRKTSHCDGLPVAEQKQSSGEQVLCQEIASSAFALYLPCFLAMKDRIRLFGHPHISDN